MADHSRITIVNVFQIDRDQIHRDPDGYPSINGQTHRYRLYLATPSDGGWLLETWRRNESENQKGIDLVPGIDALTADIADAVRHIATGEE